MTEVKIYVLPTEEGKPPRAVVGQDMGEQIVGTLATWSQDQGSWTVESEAGAMPVPQELGEAITEHAKSLGVEW